jgi:type I restriction enzyme S subunit
MKIKQYPEYKDSGIPWVGAIPDTWTVNRAKWYIKSPKELNSNEQCKQVLSLTLRGVVDNDPENPEGLVPKDYKTYQIFEKDDLVFKLIDLENISTSRVGLVHKKGIMSPAYIRAKVRNDCSCKYFYYLYYSWYLQNVYNKLGAGVRATLSSKDLLDLPILLPNKKEQDNISCFLRNSERKILRYIRNKQRIIKLYQEHKYAIVNHAVTRGTSPKVKMKSCDVNWLGEFPEHWRIKKLRTLIWRQSIKNRPDLPLLSVVRERGIILREGMSRDENHNYVPDDLSNYKVVKKGNFVINKMKSWQGSYGVSNYDGIVSPAYFIL